MQETRWQGEGRRDSRHDTAMQRRRRQCNIACAGSFGGTCRRSVELHERRAETSQSTPAHDSNDRSTLAQGQARET